MATFEIQGPAPGLTLTADLYADRSDAAAVESGVALTESLIRAGRYRGTVERSGWHQAVIKESTDTVGYWDVLLSASYVAIGHDRQDALFPPSAPAAPVVLPQVAADQVAAYVICRGVSGAVQPDISISLKVAEIIDPAALGNAWEDATQTVVSDANGLCVFVLPKTQALRFRAQREAGTARLFTVPVGVSQFQIPDLVG